MSDTCRSVRRFCRNGQTHYVAVAIFGALCGGLAAAEDGEPKIMPKVTVKDDVTSYGVSEVSSATKTSTPIRDVPQSIIVVTSEQIQDQQMLSIGDVVRYLPGITAPQGENNRDQIIVRGNNSSADFFRDGVRDDVQYYRDLYNVERVEALKGPNAMIFGRGGGGGVLNRVMKEANFNASQRATLVGGSYSDKRATVDVNQPFSDMIAVRLDAMYEMSDTFRSGVDDLKRYGINPTLTIQTDDHTKVTLGYEYFRDYRTADRGIPSFQRLPVDVDIATFYGSPDNSYVRARVNIASATIEHSFGNFSLRNRTLYGDYDRGYQNYVPGVVDATGANALLTAYNNATKRKNIFNQTDLTFAFDTAGATHTFLVGAEFGRQTTDNFRNTGFFNTAGTGFASCGGAGANITCILVPVSNPTIGIPVTFRQAATDADNHLATKISATYLQDQIELTRQWQLIAGLRFDRFDLDYQDNRSTLALDRTDNLVSPRAGVVFKPVEAISLYGSYSVSYLPSSGDQFSSLTAITEQVKPEKFTNYEVGVKWDIRPDVAMTAAVYQLDRTNTRAVDPLNPTRIVQTGSQRTQGAELGVTGNVTSAWRIAAGYAYQDAAVTSATAAARVGAVVAQVPRNSFSLWNMYQIVPKVGVGLGVIRRSDMFAATDSGVPPAPTILPGYTRVDAAAFFTLTDKIRLQVNIENVLDKKYYVNADNNNNISPGSPRAFHIGLAASL